MIFILNGLMETDMIHRCLQWTISAMQKCAGMEGHFGKFPGGEEI